MNDTIIVGVTDAAVSERAIDWAVRRAADRGGRVELLSVVGGAIGAVGEDAVISDALRATVDRFNGFARSGVDEDFHRGESAYDRYYGDPTNKPNPNLGEISHPPYYAAKLVPGDLGTKGGIVTDVHGRALRDDGSVIEGLYAAGNVSAPVMGHTYPGPGGTIGPAMTFGYLAALHIAGKA